MLLFVYQIDLVQQSNAEIFFDIFLSRLPILGWALLIALAVFGAIYLFKIIGIEDVANALVGLFCIVGPIAAYAILGGIFLPLILLLFLSLIIGWLFVLIPGLLSSILSDFLGKNKATPYLLMIIFLSIEILVYYNSDLHWLSSVYDWFFSKFTPH